MATPGTEACDAVCGALRPKWRDWPSRAMRRVLPERVAFGMLPAALFALLANCPSPVTWKIVYDTAQMRRYPVSTKLNNSQNEGAESAAPVTLDTPIQARLF